MDDIRYWSKDKLTAYIIANKGNSWFLANSDDQEMRDWARGHDRDFLIMVIAGWNKEELNKAGFRL